MEKEQKIKQLKTKSGIVASFSGRLTVDKKVFYQRKEVQESISKLKELNFETI